MNLALFDFDGTISTRDSYLLFTRFLNRKRYLLGCLVLAPRIIGYLAGLYPNYSLKEDFLRYYYRGKTTDEIKETAGRFCMQEIPAIVRPKAMERIRRHQDQGDTVVVVSACPRLILEPWCREIKVDIVATELETDAESRITGKIAGKNCWGQEKVSRIQTGYSLKEYDGIFAYGDSKGDLPMLELADTDKRYYKPFR
jgi:phosphatidylglycerophosphatase C